MSDPAQSQPPDNTRVLKVPPHSVEAEQSVLGGLMLNNEAWLNVIDILRAEDFYRLEHRLLFEAMDVLWRDNKPIDAVTLSGALADNGHLDRIGGGAFLADLAESTPGASNVSAYARIVRERSTRRQLIRAGQRIADSGFEPNGHSSDELLDQAESEVFGIAERRLENEGPQPVTPMLHEAVKEVERLYENKGQLPGLSSGFKALDDHTAGFKNSDLIVIAGRPAMGKTALALNIVEHAVIGCDRPSLVFSMEMPAEQLVLRLLSSLARIDQSKMQIGELADQDWDRFSSAVALLRDKPLYIDDTPALTPANLRARVRRAAREVDGDLGLIAVDYLQLMRPDSTRSDNRTQEISEISRAMKAVAKEMRCPLLALSQLNREVDKRPNKRPIMSDLRDSGAIEQDADLILFIYRDEVYNEESLDKGIAEVIIGKQRNGISGKTVRLSFLGSLTKFEELAPERFNDYEPP